MAAKGSPKTPRYVALAQVPVTGASDVRSRTACIAIRFSVGWPLIIRLIIQTIGLYPSGAVWTDEAPDVSRLDPSGAVQADAEHPSRNRKVVGSNPTSGSKPQVRWYVCHR